MNQELAAPVKVIANAFQRGISQTQKICKFAQKTSATLMLDTLQPAQSLEKSLTKSEERIRDAYNQSLNAFGRRYAHVLDSDYITTNRLHALALNLLEQLNGLDDYVFDPASFDLGSFPYIQRESERCCDQAVIALGNLHQEELLKAGLQQFNLRQDDREFLPSARREVGSRSRRLSDVSPMTAKPTLGLGIQLHARANQLNNVSSPKQPDSNVQMSDPNHSSQSGSNLSAISSSPQPDGNIIMGPQNHSSQSRSQSNASSNPPQSLISIPVSDPDRSFPMGNQSSSISSPPKPDACTPTAVQSEIAQNALQEPPSLQAGVQNDMPTDSHLDHVVPAPLRLISTKDKTAIKDDDKQLIKKEEVSKQISAIDEFLAKRMRSRESFRDELNRLSMISTTISPISPHPSFTVSPVLQSTPSLTDSPIVNSRPTSTLLSTIMETINAEGPPVPPKDDPWKSTSPIEEEDSGKMLINEDEPRKDSETLVHGMPTILPDTPPDSLGRQSATDDWGALGLPLAGARKVPGFGDGVVDGLEVVGQNLVSDPGLIPADENQNDLRDLTPATSVQSVDYAMRHDSSFFRYGGFCDGAKMSWRGAGGTMKEITKPGGLYVDVKVMRCICCSFEVGFNDFHRDRRLERAGTLKCQGVDDIEYRTRFLIKSHMKTKLADSPIFACMFCVEENRTLEEQDATVFFSTAQFLRHIQKHPRRLKEVDGIRMVYGPLPENVVDFDLHFLTLEAKPSPTADIKAQIASGGTGYAIFNHRPGAKGFKAVDPERRQTLQFAIGARIVGITYPAPFNGDWCSGYHDSVKALFPSSAVQFDPPAKDDILMNQKSSLAAVAKWDHRPKDNISGWLSFNKKERITHIAYPYQEFWCWSGMNSKGKWGIFPKDFLDGLVDTGSRSEPALSPGSFATSPTSGSRSHHSSRKFTLSSLSSHSSHGSHGAEKEPDQNRPTSNPFSMKRKTSGFTSSFVRRSTTVKSHTGGGSSEYAPSIASQRSEGNGDGGHDEGARGPRSPEPPKPRELQRTSEPQQPQQPRVPLDITRL